MQRVITKHALHPTHHRLQLLTTLPDASADPPREIEFTLEPIRGLTQLTAKYADHEVTFIQTSFISTQPNGEPL